MNEDDSSIIDNLRKLNDDFRTRNSQPSMTPETYNNQEVNRAPENRENTPVQEWVQEVKRHIQHGTASAFVHARVNYDIERTDEGEKVVRTKHGGFGGGYQNHLHRNISEVNAERTIGVFGAVSEGSSRFSTKDELVIPRESQRQNDTLYITIINPEHIKSGVPTLDQYRQNAEIVAKNKDIIEIRYKQPKADSDNRTSEKSVYIIAPKEISSQIQSIVRTGTDANELRDTISEVFFDGDFDDIYDATLVNFDNQNNPVPAKMPEKHDLTKVWLGVSAPLEDAKYLGGYSETIDSVTNVGGYLSKPIKPINEVAEVVEEEISLPDSPINDEQLNNNIDGENELPQPPNNGGNNEAPIPFDDEMTVESVLPFDNSWNSAPGGNGGENEPPQPPNNGGNNEAPIPFDEEPAKIEKPIKSLGPREVLAGLDLARTPEEQLHLVRELLSRLESNNSLLKENENSPTVAALEERLNDMLPEVRREVNARIHLKESAAVVRVLTSSDETTQQRYRDLYTEAERNENRRLLRNEDFTELLSKTETNGIPVQMAFNTLQQVAYEGIRLKDGTVKKYMDDKTTVQEEEFNELLSQRMISIVRYNNETDEDVRERVRVALALADKVALATLEKHVWMVDNFMASPIAQAFYLHDYRKIGDPGPIVTQRLIWGFGTSFFRQARYEEGGSKKYLFNSAEWQDVKQERRQRYAAYKTHTLQRIMPKRASDHVKETIRRGIQTIKNPRDRSERQRYFDNFRFEQNPNELLLNIGEVDYTKLSSTEYNRYLISYVPKILKVRELLLTETFDIKDLTSSDKVNSWYSAFDKMDPDNKLQLRGDFLYGAIYQMLSGGVLQHATGAELSQVYRVFTAPRRYIDDVEGNEKVDQFITPDELWKMLEDQRAWHRAGVNSVMTALAGIYQTTRR